MKIDREHRIDVIVPRGPHDDIAAHCFRPIDISWNVIAPPVCQSFDSFPHDIGIKTDHALFVHLAVKALNLGFEIQGKYLRFVRKF